LNKIKTNIVPLKKPGKTKAFFICLLIASFLWLIHALNTVYTENFKVEVRFVNVPVQRQPFEPLPQRLSIDVKASGLKLGLLMLNKPFKKLEIDFNNLKALNRNQAYVLSGSQLNLNSIFKIETQVKHISPDTLYFKENTGFQKTVPVKVPMYIHYAAGYACLKPLVQPAFVTIWGDTLAVKNTDTIYTNALQMNEVKESFTKTLTLIKPQNNLYTGLNEVSVQVQVEKLVEQEIWIAIHSIHAGKNTPLNIFPPRVKLRFTALQNNLELADTAHFKALIDEKKANKQNHKFQVFLGTVPNNITVMSIDPKEVEVLIFKP